MTRKRRSTQFHEPSLVPLADMLTNTVGIMVFILIFTVLTAGAAVIAKRLPMEQPTHKASLEVICRGNRVYPIPKELFDKFEESLVALGEPEHSLSGFQEHIVKINHMPPVEDKNVKLTAEATFSSLTVVITPKDGGGETIQELQKPGSAFRGVLKKCDPEKQFLFFLVYEDSIDAFEAAQEVAVDSKLGTGWSPFNRDKPVRICLSGGGRTPAQQ